MADTRSSTRSTFTIFPNRTGKAASTAISLLIAAVVFGALYVLLSRMQYSWNWRVPWQYRELFIQGIRNTLIISMGAIVLGFVLGLAGGIARVAGNAFARQAARFYVELFRGTPLLIQIYIFYFCIAAAVYYDNPLVIGTIALAFFSGAYITEMVRAGIESIDQGQVEAAVSTGLSNWQALRHVIFPQAFRRIIPPLAGQFVSLIKDSSLLSVISVRELTKASEIINATTYKTFEAYLPLAILYLALTFPLSYITQWLERRMKTH